MTRQASAYVSHKHATNDEQTVTVDLHVLWVPGISATVLHDLVNLAVAELHEQVTVNAA